MVHQAALNPNVNIVGCEPYINGVAMLLGKIRESKVSNVSVHPGDARDMMDVLPEQSISRAFLLYPDPWPKSRHHRRRFVTPEHLEPLGEMPEIRCNLSHRDGYRRLRSPSPRGSSGKR